MIRKWNNNGCDNYDKGEQKNEKEKEEEEEKKKEDEKKINQITILTDIFLIVGNY